MRSLSILLILVGALVLGGCGKKAAIFGNSQSQTAPPMRA